MHRGSFLASPFLLSEFPDSMKGANGIGFLLVLAWLISPVTGTGSAFEFHHLITGKERRLFGYSMGTPFQSLGDVFAHPLSTMNGPAGLFGEAYVEDVVRQTRQGRGEIEVLNTTLNGGGQMRTGVFGKQIRALGLLRVRELVLLYAPDDTTEFQFRHSSRQPLLLMQGNLVGKTLPVGISIRSSLPGFSWPDVSVQAGYRSDTFSARVGSYVMQTTGTLGILALDTDIRVETPVRKTYVHLDMTWTMPFNLTVGGRYARSEITRPSWKGTQTYQMYVSGKRAESGLFCVYEEGAKTWEAGVWATRRIGQGTSDMTVDQSLFGELTHLADTSYSVGVGIKLKRSDFHTLSSYVSYNRWSGRLVGTMATWPFTDAVVDLLGNRSYNKTNGQRTSSQGGT